MKKLSAITNNFCIEGILSSISIIGSGHINDSYLVTTSPDDAPDYVLQRINHQIFQDIPGLMNNIDIVTRHIRNKLDINGNKDQDIQVLELIPTREGKLFYTDPDDNFWRLYFHIPGSHSYDRVENRDLAYEGGRAFGMFQHLTSDIPAESLVETIPRFHDISWRLEQFENAIVGDAMNRVCTIEYEINFVRERVQEMHTIHQLAVAGELPLRVTHNDTKFNNILFDEKKRAICIVDLDTVMPGYVLYDFGDAIRTGVNTGEEDDINLENVGIDMELFCAYSKGFLEVSGLSLTNPEIDHLAFSAKFMTFIIGLRFLTDHINGDTYYKIQKPEHNLQRARAQFKLLSDMEEKSVEMEEIIKRIDGNG